MFKKERIRLGSKIILGYLISLQKKNFILLKGYKGYIMCGYLNLTVAQRFSDAAAKIVGVSSIEEALKARVHSCTRPARKLGIKKGMPVLKALQILS